MASLLSRGPAQNPRVYGSSGTTGRKTKLLLGLAEPQSPATQGWLGPRLRFFRCLSAPSFSSFFSFSVHSFFFGILWEKTSPGYHTALSVLYVGKRLFCFPKKRFR